MINDVVLALEKEAMLEYRHLSAVEESFKRQKSRVQWLNTNFFHRKMAANRMRNKILSINDEYGNRLEDPEAVTKEVVYFYEKLLGTSFPNRVEAATVMYDLVTARVPFELQAGLTCLATEEEIKATMFSIGGDKAPGPDGFNAAFFQRKWDKIGDNVVLAIQAFFITGTMPKGWNATALTLVPKTAAPMSMKEFRPIACCNVLYKCITKVLANRMQGILPIIINQSQSAFVKGRSIADNILLMQDLVRNYHRDEGPPKCAIKIVLMKAFDSVSWGFLFEMMAAMHFPNKFIKWVQFCVSNAHFSVALNGNLEGYFKGERGLRQGELMSPYLFLIVMEGFFYIL